jgi:hypothetical protein
MMKPTIFLVCFVALADLGLAQDVKDMVKGDADAPMPSRTIDPDAHIFGMAFGTQEADVIKTFGKPDGYIRFSGRESCMIYGKAVALLFDDGKLHGVRVTHSVIDWKLSERMRANAAFDRLLWKLSNGIQAETTLSEVRKILGDRLSEDKYKRVYATDKAIVSLEFSHYMDEGDTDKAYRVCGITVEAK